MATHPQSKVQEALLVFLDCRSIRATAKETGVHCRTVTRWHRDNNWDHIAARVDAEVEARVATEAATAIADNLQIAKRIQSISLQRLLTRLEVAEDPENEATVMSASLLIRIAVDMGKILGQTKDSDGDTNHEDALDELDREKEIRG